MRSKLPENLILYGYKSSGKTHFGRLLSLKLGWVFIDTDQQIEELFEQQFHQKLTCRQISLKIGEEGFRLLEAQIICHLAPTKKTVISLGGGAVLRQENCVTLNQIGTLIYLKQEKEVLRQRIFNEGTPSFLSVENPQAAFDEMYEMRKTIYETISHVHVNLHNKTDQEVLQELTNILDK